MRTAQEAVAASKRQTRNVPGTCQKTVRTWLGAPSAGDRDGDRDADAVDGWKSEPASAKHTDKNPPAGAPVAWSGGRHGYGHRALSLGNGMIRSTDAGGSGKVATVSIDWVERNWGLHYLGWSETMTGRPIPGLKVAAKKAPAKKPAAKPKSRGPHIDAALKSLEKAEGKGARAAKIKAAKVALESISHLK